MCYTIKICFEMCSEDGSAPCANGGSCVDLVDSFSCACAQGFSGEDRIATWKDLHCQINSVSFCAVQN